MTRRAPLVAALLMSSALGAASAAPSHFGAAPAGPSLSVRAGIDGVGRPGRWLPVVVTITGGDTAIDGTLDISWGESTVTQPLRLEAGGRVELHATLRALDASPGVTATITSGTDVLATANRALQLRAFDEPTRVCIGVPQSDCTVVIDPASAPSDWRALDLADDVTWTDATPPADDIARALSMWRAMRWWNDSGVTDPVLTPPDATGAGASFPVALYAGTALALLIGVMAARRRHPVFALAMPLAVTALGTAAVARDRQPAAVDTTGIVRQFAGVDGAVVSLRGEVRHGDRADVAVTPALDGLVSAVLSQRVDAATMRSVMDAEGRPSFHARAPRDRKTPFTVDATVARGWLDAITSGGGVSLRNRSTIPVTACRLRAATDRELGDLPAGASVALGDPSALTGALVECRLPPMWLSWAGGAAVDATSRAWLVFHFWPGDGLRSDDAAR